MDAFARFLEIAGIGVGDRVALIAPNSEEFVISVYAATKIGAVVVPKPDQTVTLDDITGFLKEKGLAVFKFPESLRCVEAIPHNPVGKVMRSELKPLFDDVAS